MTARETFVETVRETIVEIVRGEGYDFWTAAELVSNCIKEFIASDKRETTYYVGKSSFTLTKNS